MVEAIFSVKALPNPCHGETAPNGWAVVRCEGVLLQEVVAIYLTSEQAETAAERLGRGASRPRGWTMLASAFSRLLRRDQ